MPRARLVLLLFTVSACLAVHAIAQDEPRPYRLESVDLKTSPVIWGAECLISPDGEPRRGLAFGGQDQTAGDGRPHTRLIDGEKTVAIHERLREQNPLQHLHHSTWQRRDEVKKLRARIRASWFKGLSPQEESIRIPDIGRQLAFQRSTLERHIDELPESPDDPYQAGQVKFARGHLTQAVSLLQPPGMLTTITPELIQRLHRAQIHLELAAEAFDAEPAARAMHCGTPRRKDDDSPQAQALVFDEKTRLFVLFGGDHLDYLTNDTWVFDPRESRWTQRHPNGAPPPRANHRLEARGDGTVRMIGGYTYPSSPGYVSGQYVDHNDGAWVYDIEQDQWRPEEGNTAKLVPADSRVYRSGPFHPDYYLQGDRPDAAKFQAWLKEHPANEWVATDPPYRPRLNRDWGTARIDPDRDLMLRWSGGHSAHGGTDVPHFHFATNRWELPFPVEFPLGQLYSNTSYPNGFNFNLRPWITGHTYQNYAYDPPSKLMVKAGRPKHFYLYDPDIGDWIGRGEKPEAMQYNSCFYTLTLTATPHGAVCWDKQGRVHRFDAKTAAWIEIELSGDKLPGAYVDNSTICYDPKRDRVLMIGTPGYRQPYSGQVWAVQLPGGKVTELSPAGMDQAHRFNNVDKCCFVPTADMMLLGTYLKDSGDQAPVPAYDCAENRWVTLNLKYATGERYGRTTRAFPHTRSDGLMFDPKRNLIWGTDTNSQVYVLRLEPATAGIQPLQ